MKVEQESNGKLEDKKMDETGPPDYYKTTLEAEEKESQDRSEADDQACFALICKDLRQIMKDIHKLKTEKPEKFATEIEERRVKALILIITLRKISRIQKLRVKTSREKTTESRQGVDTVTLQLQNLLYEVSHLQKEVKRCLEFQSADQEIDLVPIDQFYIEAPCDISRPAVTVENPHEQRLAQLHWELEQRRGQTQLFDKLTQEKERIAEIINEQETKLASLGPKISNILEATLPLQSALNLPLNSQREQQQISQFLPAPLYTFWVQASAYKEACDSLMTVVIEGDVDAAKRVVTDDEDKNDGSDSEPENELLEETHSQKSRSRKDKGSESDDSKSDELKQLLAIHPLHVILTISTKEKDTVIIDFGYAQHLKVVTTKCSVDLTNKAKSMFVDVVDKEKLLISLFDGDDGSKSPNPCNEFQLLPFKDWLATNYLDILGTPFKWAQTIAGLSFLDCAAPSVSTEDNSNEKMSVNFGGCLSWQTSALQMGTTIKSIRRRLKARLSLQDQLDVLETASSLTEMPLSKELLRQHFPTKVSSDIRSWIAMSWSDFIEATHTKGLIDAGLVSRDSMIFKAIFERKNVVMDALVAVPLNYPSGAPIFALSIDWNGKETSLTNPYIKDLESEVNVEWPELVPTYEDRLRLLSLQLYRLAMCLDIFTESTCVKQQDYSAESQFHKEKIFFRPSRGRERALPFKYLSKLGVFAQR